MMLSLGATMRPEVNYADQWRHGRAATVMSRRLTSV